MALRLNVDWLIDWSELNFTVKWREMLGVPVVFMFRKL